MTHSFTFLTFLPRYMHCMQRDLITTKLSVCPSVRPSVKRVDCDKMKESSVQIFIPHERTFSLVLPTRIMVGWGDQFYLKFGVKLTPLERKRRFSIAIRS